jgi:hypothetical protein
MICGDLPLQPLRYANRESDPRCLATSPTHLRIASAWQAGRRLQKSLQMVRSNSLSVDNAEWGRVCGGLGEKAQ